jgi:hypothetical protein
MSLIIGGYLVNAQWAAPRADRELSFVPVTDQIMALRASGHQLALYQANERIAGASVFYTQSLLKDLQTEAQLQAFLAESPQHVAVIGGDQTPKPPLQILKTIMVSRQAYHFVGLAPGH